VDIIIYNKNVDIILSAHDAFLEQPSSGTLKAKIFEIQIIDAFNGNWMLWYLHFVGKRHEDSTTDSALQRTINLPVTGEAKKSK
jgi:hypothetical protein